MHHNDIKNNKKVLVFVNEFFGALDIPAKGGYGFLARYLLPYALNLSKDSFVVCVGKSKNYIREECFVSEDGIKLIKLPKIPYFATKIINKYDIVISIEATIDYLFKLSKNLNKKILFWIQDPRPLSDWQEISTVNIAKEDSWYNEKTNMLIKKANDLGKIKFVTQANYLSKKAIELYKLPNDLNIDFLPNPIFKCDVPIKKRDDIIFLGRIDSVKRGWIFCEIAKRMPRYNFYVLGASTNLIEKNKNSIIQKYANVKNLHFVGHVDGNEKKEYLRSAKILVNTSIHEALPISFLEAFSYGIIVISNQNPDNLVSTYGKYVGECLGDGMDKVDQFIESINYIMEHEDERAQLAFRAKEYVNNVHGFNNFRKIFENVASDL